MDKSKESSINCASCEAIISQEDMLEHSVSGEVYCKFCADVCKKCGNQVHLDELLLLQNNDSLDYLACLECVNMCVKCDEVNLIEDMTQVDTEEYKDKGCFSSSLDFVYEYDSEYAEVLLNKYICKKCQ